MSHLRSRDAELPTAFHDLEIEVGDDDVTAVARTQGIGEASAPLALPEDAQWLEHAAVVVRGGTRRGVEPEEDAAAPILSPRALGEQLFHAIFAGNVGRLYDRALQDAESSGRGLRIRLRVRAPRLALLPWELLYDPQARRHLGTAAATPIVRHLDVVQHIRPLAVEGKLSILAVSSSPEDLPRLDLATERARLEGGLAATPAEDRPSVTWCENPSAEALLEALQQGKYHVVHFAGHGLFDRERGEGALALTGADGRAKPLPAQQLGDVLADHASLRLVVLNACQGAQGDGIDGFSSLAARLVVMGVPAVVAMSAPVGDEDAIAFAHAFYGGLARFLPVDAAVNLGRKALSVRAPDEAAWATPVLFLRSPSGEIFRRRRFSRRVVLAAAATVALAAGGAVAALLWWPHPPIPKPVQQPSAGALPALGAARAELLVVLRVPGAVGHHEFVPALSLPDAGDTNARCAGFTYCVEIPGAGAFPVPQNGILLSPDASGARGDLADATEPPAVVRIDAPVPSSRLGAIRLFKREDGKLAPCERGRVSCEPFGGGARCEVYELAY